MIIETMIHMDAQREAEEEDIEREKAMFGGDAPSYRIPWILEDEKELPEPENGPVFRRLDFDGGEGHRADQGENIKEETEGVKRQQEEEEGKNVKKVKRETAT